MHSVNVGITLQMPSWTPLAQRMKPRRDPRKSMCFVRTQKKRQGKESPDSKGKRGRGNSDS